MSSGEISGAERRDWLRLARAEGVGPVNFRYLIGRFGSAGAALDALPEMARRAGRGSAPAIPSVVEVEAELDAGAAMGATLLTSGEAVFPRGLANLDPPPPVIWALGDASLLQRRSVGVVGARVASAAGRKFAHGIAGELGAAGLTIVSGLARGIDAAAHEGSLETGTVAVLGGGVGDIYPAENEGLYHRIAAKGCIVSESEPGRRAQAKDFPRRNRLISGLALAIVVVEAELKSGSLITARLAAEQGREVLAVPGSPLDPRARGCNDLLRQGAAICEGADDVLRAIETLHGFNARPPDLFDRLEEEEASDAVRETVLGLLSPTPVSIDELARMADAPVSAVFAALLELSLAGRAELLPGAMAVRG